MDPSAVFLTYVAFLLVVRGAKANTEILRSLAATAKQSTTFNDNGVYWTADRAIDGSTSTISGSCGCCAATVHQYQPWLQIDLGRLYRVSMVEVIGRTDNTDTFGGMYITLRRQSTNVQTVTIPQVLPQFQYHEFRFDPPVISQYVTLQLSGDFVTLVVCEVKIYSKDCSAGTYGASCNETCGRCQNSAICDHVTGECGLCEPGYRGLTCKDNCQPGTFGQNCNSACHCQNNQTCNHVTGACPDDKCDIGWHGNNCSLECEPGTFGQNCLYDCGHCYGNEVCNRRTGACSLCSTGYRGLQCIEECSPGTFGQNCSSICGNCRDTCSVITGVCSVGCLPGYTGTYCTEVCDNGFYGDKCQSNCGHCACNTTCNNTNGRCEDGCNRGYTGDRCDIESQNLESNSGSPSSLVIGVLVGTIVVLMCVIVVLLVIIWRIRRDTTYEEPNWNTRETKQERTYAELDNNVLQQEPNRDILEADSHEYAEMEMTIRREARPSDNAGYVNT